MKPYYEHAGITIYHGDCREIMPGLQADAVVTDPPYGVGLDYGPSVDDSPGAWRDLMLWFVPAVRAAAPFAVFPSCRIVELTWIYAHIPPDWLICWYKGSPGTSAAIGFNDWEPHLVYGRPHAPMHDHFYATPEPHTNGHPCPKPMAWALWLVSRAVPVAGVLCDPFMGSGTTLRAAKDMGRRAIGIEIEERYCEIAAKRLAQEVLL